MKDTVTNRDLYTEIIKVHDKIDNIVEKRITPLERAVDKMWTYGSMGILVISFIFTSTWEFVKVRFFKNI